MTWRLRESACTATRVTHEFEPARASDDIVNFFRTTRDALDKQGFLRRHGTTQLAVKFGAVRAVTRMSPRKAAGF